MADHFDFTFKIQGPAGESSFHIPLGISTIGRLVGSSLLLESEQVSRKHAQLACTLIDVQVTDLNSSNGSFLNGQKLTPGLPYTLSAGDTLKIGPFSMLLEQVQVQEEPAEAPVIQQEPVTTPQPATPEGQILHETPAAAAERQPIPEESRKPKRSTSPKAQTAEEVSSPNGHEQAAVEESILPGLSIYSQQLIHYLPGIYHTDFMRRFMGIFESILLPIEWNIDNFDLFLSPTTAPEGFLPWLANWFDITFQPGWTADKRRELLKQAGFIYARRGTRAAMAALLHIFTGQEPQIEDTASDLPPFTFRVKLNLRENEVNREQIGALIDHYKPAHTSYILEFTQ